MSEEPDRTQDPAASVPEDGADEKRTRGALRDWSSRVARHATGAIAVVVALVALRVGLNNSSKLEQLESRFASAGPRGATSAGPWKRRPARSGAARDDFARRPAPDDPNSAPRQIDLDVGTERARAALAVGFSGNERIDDRSVVWTEGRTAEVQFRMKPEADAYLIEIEAAAFATLAPLRVTCSLNGEQVGELEFQQEYSSERVRVASGKLVAGANTLQLAFGSTAQPSKLDPESHDTRELALLLDRIRILPAGE